MQILKRLIKSSLRLRTRSKPIKKLEIAITDFCDLDCSLCSQGTPLQKDKKTMTLEELERISRFFKPFEFDVIKISGGEPTLHSQFSEICDGLNGLFPAHEYQLATNGCLLEKYLDKLSVFHRVGLSHYPGKNDAIFSRLNELKVPNFNLRTKEDYAEMDDINTDSNLNKTGIFKSCKWTYIKKVVQSRIYPCCIIFGQSVRHDIDRDKISVPIDEHWRENLLKIDLEPYCRHCYVDVDTGKTSAD